LIFCVQVRKLEGEGLPSKQAEAITAAITEVLNDSLENVSQSLVSKGEMQRVRSFSADHNLCFCGFKIRLHFIPCQFYKFYNDTVGTNIVLVNFLFKTEMMQESNLSKFKAEVQSSQVFLKYVECCV